MPRAAPLTDPFGVVGTVFDRKYRVDRVVAEGGFGIVYAGHHLGLDAPIAIKVLKRPTGISADAWQDLLSRFVQEAQTMAKLKDPAVVDVIDTGVTEGDAGSMPWMVLEWVDGETLRDDLLRRRDEPGRTPAEALDLLRPVFHAIAEAHDLGIAHRDLKPSNVMLVKTKRGLSARVLDFGIAKVMQGDDDSPASGLTTTQNSFKAFSASHAAPEQIAGTRTGPWTDVHALGLILTELLTNRPPYESDDSTEQLAQVFDARRPTPLKLGFDVGAWEAVIARSVSIRPGDRYSSAGELQAALEEALPKAFLSEIPGAARPSKKQRVVLGAGADGTATTSPVSSDSVRARSAAATRLETTRRISRAPVWAGVAVLGALVVLAGVVAVRGIQSNAAAVAPSAASAPRPVETTPSAPATTAPAPEVTAPPVVSASVRPPPEVKHDAGRAIPSAAARPDAAAPPPATASTRPKFVLE